MEAHVFTGARVPLNDAHNAAYIPPHNRLSDLRSDKLCAAFARLSYIALVEKTGTVTSPLYIGLCIPPTVIWQSGEAQLAFHRA